MYYPYTLLLLATVLVMVDRSALDILFLDFSQPSYSLLLRPFVLILFKSFNIEEMYRLLVVGDPASPDYSPGREV